MNRRAFMQGVMAALAASSAPIALGAGAAKQTTMVGGLIDPSITDVGNGWFRVQGGVGNGFRSVFDLGDGGIKALSSDADLTFSFFAKAPDGGQFVFTEDGKGVMVEGAFADLNFDMLQLHMQDRPRNYLRASGEPAQTNPHNLLPWSEGKPK
jgi:hypothetical protein